MVTRSSSRAISRCNIRRWNSTGCHCHSRGLHYTSCKIQRSRLVQAASSQPDQWTRSGVCPYARLNFHSDLVCQALWHTYSDVLLARIAATQQARPSELRRSIRETIIGARAVFRCRPSLAFSSSISAYLLSSVNQYINQILPCSSLFKNYSRRL